MIPSPMRTPDHAKRLRDTIATHQMALSMDEIIAGRFLAIKLEDATSDMTAYPNRGAAIDHQSIPDLYFYPQLPPMRWNENVCDTLLWYNRKAFEAGFRWRADSALIVPTKIEDIQRVNRSTH